MKNIINIVLINFILNSLVFAGDPIVNIKDNVSVGPFGQKVQVTTGINKDSPFNYDINFNVGNQEIGANGNKSINNFYTANNGCIKSTAGVKCTTSTNSPFFDVYGNKETTTEKNYSTNPKDFEDEANKEHLNNPIKGPTVTVTKTEKSSFGKGLELSDTTTTTPVTSSAAEVALLKKQGKSEPIGEVAKETREVKLSADIGYETINGKVTVFKYDRTCEPDCATVEKLKASSDKDNNDNSLSSSDNSTYTVGPNGSLNLGKTAKVEGELSVTIPIDQEKIKDSHNTYPNSPMDPENPSAPNNDLIKDIVPQLNDPNKANDAQTSSLKDKYNSGSVAGTDQASATIPDSNKESLSQDSDNSSMQQEHNQAKADNTSQFNDQAISAQAEPETVNPDINSQSNTDSLSGSNDLLDMAQTLGALSSAMASENAASSDKSNSDSRSSSTNLPVTDVRCVPDDDNCSCRCVR